MAGNKASKTKWKKVMSNVDLEEPTPIIDQVYLGCTHHESETNERIAAEKQDLFTKLASSTTSKITNFNNDTKRNLISSSYDMQGHAQKCVERFCELANRTTDKLHNVSTPCLDDHQFKTKTMGELSEVCSRIVFICLYLAPSGRPDILCTVNHLARHVTKWNRACDKR